MTITDILQEWNSGDRDALNRLMGVVRQRLYELAEHKLQSEAKKVLQPTELLNEVYLRLTEYDRPNFRDRNHFFGVAARLIRRILVDLSRRNRAGKRDITLLVENVPEDLCGKDASIDLEALDAALDKLSVLDPRQGRVVELRYFGGFSIVETGQLLGISPMTVKRDWLVAKAWLKRELGE